MMKNENIIKINSITKSPIVTPLSLKFILKFFLIMHFKERGFTVGDLITLIIVLLFSFLLINKINESKTQKQITNLYQLEILKKY